MWFCTHRRGGQKITQKHVKTPKYVQGTRNRCPPDVQGTRNRHFPPKPCKCIPPEAKISDFRRPGGKITPQTPKDLICTCPNPTPEVRDEVRGGGPRSAEQNLTRGGGRPGRGSQARTQRGRPQTHSHLHPQNPRILAQEFCRYRGGGT